MRQNTHYVHQGAHCMRHGTQCMHQGTHCMYEGTQCVQHRQGPDYLQAQAGRMLLVLLQVLL